MENYICKIGSLDEINEKWDYEIKNHSNNNRWQIWKNKIIKGVNDEKIICYYGIKIYSLVIIKI